VFCVFNSNTVNGKFHARTGLNMPVVLVYKIPTDNYTYYSRWDIEFVFREAANLNTMVAVHFAFGFCKFEASLKRLYEKR